ncbi:MAG: tripartite tricarboxylate transporter permease [archaeon]
MIFQFAIAVLLGIFAGTITGLTPGIHINLVGIFIISLSATILSSVNPVYLIIFITSMAITHTFIDFIPSVFLGCPDTDTELSILPGHELLKKGFGYEAIILTSYGGLAAVFLLIIISYPSVILISKTYPVIKNFIPYILIFISAVLIFSEKKKINSLIVFTLTGLLGLSVLNINIKEPLLPLLSGLFGSSMLILSIKNKTKISKQKITYPRIKIFRPLLGAVIASPLCSFLPGLGSGQAAIIGNTISRTDRKGFLVLLGATNTFVMGFSFIALYCISKTRTGAAVAVKEILKELSTKNLLIILQTIFITGCLAFLLAIFLARIFSKKIEKINYTTLSLIVLIILLNIVFLVSGISGVVVFIASTLTGIYCISLKVRRTQMMGCLLVPTIILYLF